MKRKKYINFALPRVIAGLLIAAVLFGVTAAVFYDRYYSHIYGGFSNYSQVFENILNAYDEGKTDKAFVNIMCSIYQADYIRLKMTGLSMLFMRQDMMLSR